MIQVVRTGKIILISNMCAVKYIQIMSNIVELLARLNVIKLDYKIKFDMNRLREIPLADEGKNTPECSLNLNHEFYELQKLIFGYILDLILHCSGDEVVMRNVKDYLLNLKEIIDFAGYKSCDWNENFSEKFDQALKIVSDLNNKVIRNLLIEYKSKAYN